MRIWTKSALVPLAGILILQSCDSRRQVDPADHLAADPPALRRGNGGDPQTLDPARAEDIHAFRVLTDLYEGLVTIDSDGSLIPGAADRWDISTDGRIYTFYLGTGVQWSNGEPLEADHFVAGFRRALSPETNSAYAFLLYPIENAESVREGDLPPASLGVNAPDANTLVIRLQTAAPHMLSVLTMPIAAPLWTGGNNGTAQFSDPDYFVGNGPFVLRDWHPGSMIRLSRNPTYHRADEVDLTEVEYFAISDPLSELNMFRAGELHITATVPGSYVRNTRSNPDPQLRIAPSLGIYYVAFDLTEKPLSDRTLRQALTMAVDRESLVQITGRGEQAAYGLIPDGIPGYEAARFDWSRMNPTERETEARRLFELTDFSGEQPPRLTLTYDAGDVHETIALAVSAMWRDVLGIDVLLDKREWKYFLATRENRDEWQVMRFAWTGDYNHPGTFADILRSTSPQNLPRYENKDYDELVKSAGASPDTAVQMRLFAAAEATLLEDYPLAPLYFFVSKHLVADSVSGFDDNSLDRHPSRFIRVAATD